VNSLSMATKESHTFVKSVKIWAIKESPTPVVDSSFLNPGLVLDLDADSCSKTLQDPVTVLDFDLSDLSSQLATLSLEDATCRHPKSNSLDPDGDLSCITLQLASLSLEDATSRQLEATNLTIGPHLSALYWRNSCVSEYVHPRVHSPFELIKEAIRPQSEFCTCRGATGCAFPCIQGRDCPDHNPLGFISSAMAVLSLYHDKLRP
jgi:hypothetical protein